MYKSLKTPQNLKNQVKILCKVNKGSFLQVAFWTVIFSDFGKPMYT